MKREKKQVVDFEAFEIIREERDALQGQLQVAKRANDSLMEEVKQLKVQATEAHDQFQKRVGELTTSCVAAAQEVEAQRARVQTAERVNKELNHTIERLSKENDEKQRALVEYVDRLNHLERDFNIKRMELTSAKDQITAQVEVIERLKTQNSNFCEEQREAKKRADATAASLVKAKDEVARLVELNNAFKDRLAAVTEEKNKLAEIAENATRERFALQADYDARGKVIKKLRKRLHKLKKKLKH